MSTTLDRGPRDFLDRYGPDDYHVFSMGPALFAARTAFQQVEIREHPTLGRCLLLDDALQTAALDEHVYHEALVHPAMVLHPNPRRVLVLGGGEGATLREVLRHRTVRKAVMVDIDGELVDACRVWLPAWHAGAFDDPRSEIHAADGRAFLAASPGRFDVIISDLTDPAPTSLSAQLWSRQFFALCRDALTPGGIFVTQAAGLRYTARDQVHADVHATLAAVFGIVRSYAEYVTGYDQLWSFVLASDRHDPRRLRPGTVDRRLQARGVGELRYYDGETHTHLFALPRTLRATIQRGRVRDDAAS